ncbi:MAG: hypothetical protein AVDCRST_MAG43-114, partial [uncultured Thermomicrobiales bacterium]
VRASIVVSIQMEAVAADVIGRWSDIRRSVSRGPAKGGAKSLDRTPSRL